jgi:tetratricopeptide (TPR) repeat protein
MSLRIVLLASVCSAFLAASAAVSGAAAATAENQLVSEAYQALQAGDPATAVMSYGKAIESRALEPEVLANALLNRGLAYQRLNEHEFAIDDYTAALRIDAMSAKLRALALYNRGLSYQRLQRNALAMEDYTSALFLDGQFSHAYFSRGTLLRDGGQHLFALADFDKALRFSYPDPARVYVAQSVTYERLKRLTEARGALQNALAANPGYEPAVKRLAVLNGEPVAPVPAADTLQTATVTPASNPLPEAAAPSGNLALEKNASMTSGTASTKLYTDRVPQAVNVAAIAAPKAPEAPAAEERILAVEVVPDDQPPAAAVEPAAEEAASAEPPQPAAQEVASIEQPQPEAEAPAAPPVVSGWSVQIASATSEEAAWSSWKKMKARNKALADQEPVVVRADLGAKGVFFRLRLVGFETQGEASRECARLKSRGVKCFISKAAS